MKTVLDVIGDGVEFLTKGFGNILGFYEEEEETMYKKSRIVTGFNNGVADTNIKVSEDVLNDFQRTVGLHRPETGGMLACKYDMNLIDDWCFDKKSVNTSASYSYDVEEMGKQFAEWKEKGIRSVGFVHSHPSTYRQPSYDDIATARALMKFFKNDFFYLPIIISDRKGYFTMYFFVVRQKGLYLNVNLDYVQRATADGYEYVSFRKWEENYQINEVEAYYNRVNGIEEKPARHIAVESKAPLVNPAMRPISETMSNNMRSETVTHAIPVVKENISTPNYFERLDGVYPEKVLDKVIVCVGTGGARTYLENMARNGFRNFILIDGDKISLSNIATQGVFISEMGMWKTEAIKNRINDINPKAKVICVNRFLDDEFTDDEFNDCLRNFLGKEPTDYLVLGCCDTFDGNRRSSELSLKYGLTYIGAGMYKGGLAAEIVFVYPGVTPSCPRCMLRSRYEAYENEGYKNDVTSAGCPTFATERLNTLLGFISIMMLMYGDAPSSQYNRMLDEVKDRNFVWIRMNPYLGSSDLGIRLFDRVFGTPETSSYTFFDETAWLPQHPDAPEFGEKTCKLCGGVGDLRKLKYRWSDTRKIS